MKKKLRKDNRFVSWLRIFVGTSVVISIIYLFVLRVVSNYYSSTINTPAYSRQLAQLFVLIIGYGALFFSFDFLIFNMIFGIKCIAFKRVSISSFLIFLVQNVLILCFIFLFFHVSLAIS